MKIFTGFWLAKIQKDDLGSKRVPTLLRKFGVEEKNGARFVRNWL